MRPQYSAYHYYRRPCMIQTYFKSKHNGLPTLIVYPIDFKCGAPFSITLARLQIFRVCYFHASERKSVGPIPLFYEIDSGFIVLARCIGVTGPDRLNQSRIIYFSHLSCI